MNIDGVFVGGACVLIFGIILLIMGMALPNFMPILLPVALVFIACGIAFKIISITKAK